MWQSLLSTSRSYSLGCVRVADCGIGGLVVEGRRGSEWFVASHVLGTKSMVSSPRESHCWSQGFGGPGCLPIQHSLPTHIGKALGSPDSPHGPEFSLSECPGRRPGLAEKDLGLLWLGSYFYHLSVPGISGARIGAGVGE